MILCQKCGPDKIWIQWSVISDSQDLSMSMVRALF